VRYEEKFDPAPQSAGEVRRFVARHLPADVDIDLVVLLATELATNALLHARTAFEVEIDISTNEITVGIRDSDPTVPVPTEPDDQATSGRGLRMVRLGAASWGIDAGDDGKRIWFAVARHVRT
jgi:two-component sensor histidine kinase